MPTAPDANTNWGVEGKFKSEKDANRKYIIDPDSKIIKDDKKILNDIVSKVDSNINSLGELEKYLQSYTKVNNEALNSIISKLNAFKQAIKSELENVK